jgi:hypothetical protein
MTGADRLTVESTEEPTKQRRWLNFFGHVSRFGLHALVFLPICVLSVIAGFYGVQLRTVLLTALFAWSSVTLEICWSCVLKKYDLMQLFGVMARRSDDRTNRIWYEDRLSETRIWFNWYIIFTAFSFVGWVMVALCEVVHMKGGTELSSSALISAGAFASFNWLVAAAKLWIVTRHESGSYLPDSSVSFSGS